VEVVWTMYKLYTGTIRVHHESEGALMGGDSGMIMCQPVGELARTKLVVIPV